MDRPRTSLLACVGGLFGLPLVAGELLQQAVRPQTYVIRAGYAILLFGAWAFAAALGGNTVGRLGAGAPLLQVLVNLQFFGIYLFMPALACGVIPDERERGSFDLLLLTRLGLTRILLEKLLSRLVPMGTFLLLTTPLLAYAYALGGVEPRDLLLAVWFLSLTAVQVGCLSLICSARCQRTITALIATYATELLLIGPWAWHWSQVSAVVWSGDYPLFPPAIYGMAVVQPEIHAFASSLPTLGASLLCFLVARVVLGLHALPASPGTSNQPSACRLRPGSSSQSADDLPDERPILWLERRRTRSHQRAVQIIWAAEWGLIIVCCVMGGQADSSQITFQFSVLMWCLWAFVVLAVTVKGAIVFPTERARQTLDVLLSTPFTGREIVLQKFAGVNRLVRLLSVPFVTAMLLSAYAHESVDDEFPVCAYIVCSLLTFAIYLPLCGWLSCWIGLHSKNQVRAILKSLAVLFAWCLWPLVPALAFGSLMLMASPLTVPALNETGSLWELVGPPSPGSEFIPVILNSLVYGFWLAIIRQKCLQDAPFVLGQCNEADKISMP